MSLIFHNSRTHYLGGLDHFQFSLKKKHKIIHSLSILLSSWPKSSLTAPFCLGFCSKPLDQFRSLSLKYSNHNLTLNLSLSWYWTLNLKLLSVLLVKANSQWPITFKFLFQAEPEKIAVSVREKWDPTNCMSRKPCYSNSPFIPTSDKSVFCKAAAWVDLCCTKVFPEKITQI